MKRISAILAAALVLAGCGASSPPTDPAAGHTDRPQPGAPATAADGAGVDGSGVPAPDQPVRLIFIHHSTGEAWLADDSGGLGRALADSNYFVSDTNYGWGPVASELGGPIGDYTDIGNWWNWFLGPSSDAIMDAVYSESGQNSSYSRLDQDPGGPNQVVLFKSCFPNSNIEGNPADAPTTGDNPLAGAGLDGLTVANAKGMYADLLEYFGAHTDTLFVAITAPPLLSSDTSPEAAANARAFNRWLVTDWLAGYPHANVAVFDFYDVLTSNGGDPDRNDLGAAGGNHHRVVDGEVEYVTDQGSNTSAYAANGDSHPTAAGDQKATAEFVPMLNLFYERWREDG
jgi:hypothetical protein